MTDDIYHRARQYWNDAGVSLLPPADEESVWTLFAELGMPLSEGVLQLYTTVGGFEFGSTHEEWALWGLDQLRRENLQRDRAEEHISHLWFADYLIFSHVYAFQFESMQQSSVCIHYFHEGRTTVEPVAESVAEFLQTTSRILTSCWHSEWSRSAMPKHPHLSESDNRRIGCPREQ